MVQCTRALAHACASSRGVNLPIGGSIHTLVPMDRGSKYLWRVGPGVQIPGGSNYTPTPATIHWYAEATRALNIKSKMADRGQLLVLCFSQDRLLAAYSLPHAKIQALYLSYV